MQQIEDALVVLLCRQFNGWSCVFGPEAKLAWPVNDPATIAAANPASHGTDLRDDRMILYFASPAFFSATPAYCLHLSCIVPAIWAQRPNASAASLKRLKFSRSAPRMKRSV